MVSAARAARRRGSELRRRPQGRRRTRRACRSAGRCTGPRTSCGASRRAPLTSTSHPARDRERGERDEQRREQARPGGPELAESDQGRGRSERPRCSDRDGGRTQDPRMTLRGDEGDQQGHSLEDDRDQPRPIRLRRRELEDQRARIVTAGSRSGSPSSPGARRSARSAAASASPWPRREHPGTIGREGEQAGHRLPQGATRLRKHRLKAEYKGSKLFLGSRARP